MNMPIETLALAMTGASGAAYGLRLLELLLEYGINVQLMISGAGQIVINQETDLALPSSSEKQRDILLRKYPADSKQLQVFGTDQWFAPPASGTGVADAMVVCPCTVGMVSAVACGASNNLMERAADVIIKEQKKLILVVRETPFSAIHLENMLKLARMSVSILPASPGFYYNATRVSDLVDFVVARILDQLNIQHALIPAWGQDRL
ncbi:MAG: aromatic acid decarboxylase [Gammaproteobacteria bacterium]|nr:MAG: aromatic acid decarboxylase [Gammaproteobacteria bacterium]